MGRTALLQRLCLMVEKMMILEDAIIRQMFHTHFYGVSSLSKGDEIYIKKILEAMPQSKKELFFPIIVLPDKKIISYRCCLDGSNLVVAEDPVMCVADFEK